jgi:hypothetical protein
LQQLHPAPTSSGITHRRPILLPVLTPAPSPDVANIDAQALALDDSIPPALVAAPPLPAELAPPGNGPGILSLCEPLPSPPHGGLLFRVDPGANMHVTCHPDELAHRVRHSCFHSAPGPAHFTALQNIVFFVSSVTAAFHLTGSVAAVTAALHFNFASMQLALRRVGSSDPCSHHFTQLLPLVPFWTHTNAVLGARCLTRRHFCVLGFDPVPRNRHLASLFGVDLRSVQNSRQLLGGMNDSELTKLTHSLASKRVTWIDFDPVPHNCHIAPLFGVDLSSVQTAGQLRGMNDSELTEPTRLLASKRVTWIKGRTKSCPSSNGLHYRCGSSAKPVR